MASKERQPAPPLRLGLPVWGYRPWIGEFFATNTQPANFLKHYATVFNTVEGNTTFYGLPDKEMVLRWKQQTPEGFKFCFKLPKQITHGKMLRGVDELLTDFFSRLEVLEGRLGPFMIQLPAGFGPDNMETLRHFLAKLPRRYNYGLEVRHHSFFDKGRNERALDRLLSSYNIDRVIFDTRKLHSVQKEDEEWKAIQQKKPRLPVRFKTTGIHPILRYVGVNDKLNNTAYLKEWAIVIADWIHQGYHPYVFIHAPDEFYAPKLATYFHSLLSDLVALPPLPTWPIKRGGDDKAQLSLF